MIRRAAAAVFLLTFAVYAAALCPSPYWLDSSEFAAASVLLGVPHPPGHPLAVLLGKAASLVPLGPMALRVGLGQAACSALAAALLTVAGAALSRRVRAGLLRRDDEDDAPLSPEDIVLGAAAALCTSLGYAVGFQAVRPEVYALHRLLAAGALLAAVRFDEGEDRRWLTLAALLLGLALANHHFLALLLIAPAPVLLLRRGRAAAIAPCLAAGAVGLLLYAYLPLRAAHHPLLNWGVPDTWGRFLWTISARAFQRSVKEPQGDDADVVGALLEAVHPIGALLGALGLYLLVRRRPARLLGAYLGGAIALIVLGRAVLGFDIANPDAHGYLVPAIDMVALCAAAGAGGLLVAVRRTGGRRAVAALLLLGGALWGAIAFPRIDRSRFWDLDVLVGGWLAEAPPRALVLSGSFQTVFGLWYLRGVEGQRPDVQHLHPHFLSHPGYRENEVLRHPEAPEVAALLGPDGLSLPALLRSRRQVRVEYDLDAPPALVPYLYPAGLAEAMSPQPPPAGATVAEAQRRRRDVVARVDVAGEGETRRNVLWRSFVAASLACQQGDGRTLAAELRRSRTLMAGARSPELDQLGECLANLAGTRRR